MPATSHKPGRSRDASEHGAHAAGIGMILIGDELLTGKRRDQHMPAVIDRLAQRGLELDWVRIVGDDGERLQATLADSLAGEDIVFCFGGIGPTPDDRTRQCAAAAAGRALEINAEGRAALLAHYGAKGLTRNRLVMVEWPVGAEMIPNPVNQVPGFSLGRHHFVPGFPSMAWPMVEWVLNTYYAHAGERETVVEYLLEARDISESAIVDDMQAVTDAHPGVRVACLPSADGRRLLEFGIRGARQQVEAASRDLCERLQQQGISIVRLNADRD